MHNEFLAPPDAVCAVCGECLAWVVGGVRCPRETADARHDGCCILCGMEDEDCECEDA
jgi:hypothetical protein